jgi:hypothetical protein
MWNLNGTYAARLSRKKTIVVSAALLPFFIVGLTPPGPPDLRRFEIFSRKEEWIREGSCELAVCRPGVPTGRWGLAISWDRGRPARPLYCFPMTYENTP